MENALNNLAANEVAVPTYRGNNIADGWFVEDKNTGKRIGYVDMNGKRKNYNE
jgi:hypothetical protein